MKLLASCPTFCGHSRRYSRHGRVPLVGMFFLKPRVRGPQWLLLVLTASQASFEAGSAGTCTVGEDPDCRSRGEVPEAQKFGLSAKDVRAGGNALLQLGALRAHVGSVPVAEEEQEHYHDERLSANASNTTELKAGDAIALADTTVNHHRNGEASWEPWLLAGGEGSHTVSMPHAGVGAGMLAIVRRIREASAVLLEDTLVLLQCRMTAAAGGGGSYIMVFIAALACVIFVIACLILRRPEKDHGTHGGELSRKENMAIPHDRDVCDHGPGMSIPGLVPRLPLPVPASPPESLVNSLSVGQLSAVSTPATSNRSLALHTTPMLPPRTPFVPQRTPELVALPEPPPDTRSSGLCPGLVVPADRECVLAVQALSDLRSSNRLDILDTTGNQVLMAHIVRPWPKEAAAFKQRPPVITLCPADSQEGRLTFCRAGGEGGGCRSMHIYDKDDQLFGSIRRDMKMPRYVLDCGQGRLKLFFEGDFQRRKINVLTDSKEMWSQTEPSNMLSNPRGNYCQVRIAGGVDVGLIISGLLSIDAMESL